MYMNQSELYIDKVTNIPYSGIDESRSASLSGYSGQTISTTFSYTSPSIGQRAGIYRGSISARLDYISDPKDSATFEAYFSLGGTYRLVTRFADSLADTSLTNIKVVSGKATYWDNKPTLNGTSDLRGYVRIA